ncbi:MAG: carbohydrate-binding family 9-like protein [Cytophagaceae bacterium]|nr:carbohydrate-binding family 9-like protein [Cytophagaceae bacterium]
MISTEEYKFNLEKKQKKTTQVQPHFKYATDGRISDFKTEVEVWYSEDYFNIKFECKGDDFVNQNIMQIHNAPLYNQEVFEVFISEGEADPKKYLEVEINPNNALWIGWIDNPTLGSETQTLNKMVDPEEAKILHAVQKLKTVGVAPCKYPGSSLAKK